MRVVWEAGGVGREEAERKQKARAPIVVRREARRCGQKVGFSAQRKTKVMTEALLRTKGRFESEAKSDAFTCFDCSRSKSAIRFRARNRYKHGLRRLIHRIQRKARVVDSR